jgi:hypothetical protein
MTRFIRFLDETRVYLLFPEARAEVPKSQDPGSQNRNLDWIRAKAPFGPGILGLEDEETGKEGAFDDAYWM